MKSFLPVPKAVAFSVFGIDIMWYGILMSSAVMLAFVILYYRAKKKSLNQERIWDLIIWCVPSGIIGARLYYVIFEWGRYKDDLMQIFNLRAGGLAIHGAIIGGFGVAILVLRHYHDNVAAWIDTAIVSVPLAQSIARWGNYFNQEAHGVETNLPWAIECQGKMVHPTFLYESIWCLLLFIFLLWFADTGKQKFDYQITLLYGMLYSVERIFVEGLRTDSLYIGPFRQAQVLSACIIIISVVLYIILSKKKKNEKILDDQNIAEDETSSL